MSAEPRRTKLQSTAEGTESKGQDAREADGARLPGPDLLRCIAMLMIVALHYLGKGGLLPALDMPGRMGVQGVAAWAMECLAIVAVNVYMLISGYFLSRSGFKLRRLISLLVQVWLYSVLVGAAGIALGLLPAEEVDTHLILTLLFPVSMEHYWFLTAYIFLYLLLPLLGNALREMSRARMTMTLLLLFFAHSLLKSVLPFRLETDNKGYSFLWYLCLFVLAAYLRRFPPKLFQKKSICFLLYLLGSAGAFAESFVLRAVYLRTGSLSWILSVPLEYNHFFPLTASVGLFGCLLGAGATGRSGIFDKISAAAKWLAPYTLGVYLLHENITVRYAWQEWLGAGRVSGTASLIGHTLLAVVCVFAAGIAADFLRAALTRGVSGLLRRWKPYARLAERIRGMDTL